MGHQEEHLAGKKICSKPFTEQLAGPSQPENGHYNSCLHATLYKCILITGNMSAFFQTKLPFDTLPMELLKHVTDSWQK